jgi:hypothetical protein
MVDFLNFLHDLETLEVLFESRNRLLRILATLEFWNLVKTNNPFLNYPESPRHYENLFRNHILPLLVRRTDYIENDAIDPDVSLTNQFIPSEMISCCNILLKCLFQKCPNFSCISTNTDLKSNFHVNNICLTYIEGNNDRFVNLFQCYNIKTILNDELNENDYIRALKIAATVFAIQTNRIVDPFDIRPFSEINFDNNFIHGLFNEADFFLKPPKYRKEVIRAISCAIYDINDHKTHLHLLSSSPDRLYSGYVYKHGKSAPDGKSSRILVKYEKSTIIFKYYIPDFH